MSEIGDLLYCPAVMVGCSDCHIVWQDDDMIPRGLIDFVRWARRAALREGEITLQEDAPSGPEIRSRQEFWHDGILSL
jgi:hypothetical protein